MKGLKGGQLGKRDRWMYTYIHKCWMPESVHVFVCLYYVFMYGHIHTRKSERKWDMAHGLKDP